MDEFDELMGKTVRDMQKASMPYYQEGWPIKAFTYQSFTIKGLDNLPKADHIDELLELGRPAFSAFVLDSSEEPVPTFNWPPAPPTNVVEMPDRHKTYTSFYENGEWRSARVFVLPGGMSIAAILRFERATGRQTHVTPRGHLEMVKS